MPSHGQIIIASKSCELKFFSFIAIYDSIESWLLQNHENNPLENIMNVDVYKSKYYFFGNRMRDQ